MAEKQATLWLKIKSTGESVLGDVKDKLGGIFNASNLVIAGFVALGAAIVKSIEAYKEKESALKELSTAMVNNGIFTADLRNKYLEQADALSKVTLFQDEQIIKAQAVIQQMIGQREVSEELMRATLDLAQAKGINLTQASEMVAKSIGGGRNALKAYGIEVTETATKTEKMQQVIDGLNSKFGGQAKAATEGLGSITTFSNSIANLGQELGEKLAPYVNWFMGALTRIVSGSEETRASFDVITFSARALGSAFEIVAGTISIGWNTIIGGAATAANVFAELIEGNFKRAWEAAKAGTEVVKNEIVNKATETYDSLVKLNDAENIAKQQKIEKDQQLEAAARAKKREAAEIEMAENAVIQEERMLQEQAIRDSMIVSQDQFEKAQLQAAIKYQDELLKNATSAKEKAAILQTKYNLLEQMQEKKKNDLLIADRNAFLGQIAGLQNSSNSTLATLGKAAAIFQIQLEGSKAAASALAWGTSLGGPALGALFQGISYAATAAQIAQVAGLKLAEGGIVMPRPGGVQATIAEAGQAEAVIPLDRAGEFGLGGGGGVTIIVNGGLLGDQSSAREFAVTVDRELYKLRKNNESVAFEGIVI